MTSLCLLAQKYYVDKCPAIYHHYTPKYHKLLKDKKVTVFLEIGIGNHKLMAPIVGDHYIHGASLRMWRDYFPQAEIIGCDILEEVLFQEDRIRTYKVDQSSSVSLINMMNNIDKKCDVILDDGSHQQEHQILSFKTLWQYVADGGFYIIEDIHKENLEEMSELSHIFEDCKLRHIHEHNLDQQGFIVFVKREDLSQ